jgi:uncharacterized protein YndB with AHSA1/START domain
MTTERGSAMTTDLSTSASVTIDASPADVWRALTTPSLIKQWFFGVDTRTDWTEGSEIVHTGEWQGKPYVDKGTIVRFEPERLLVHTHWSDISGVPDRPEHYQEVTWSLAGRDGKTELTVSETNLPSEQTKSVSESSWQTVLRNLKELVES